MRFDLNVALGLDDFEDSSSQDGVSSSESVRPSISPVRITESLEEATHPDEDKCRHDTVQGSRSTPTSPFLGDSTDMYFEATEIEKKFGEHCILSELEHFYLLYCEYGRLKGFSVRRGDQRYFGKSKDIRWKEFTCSCRGNPNETKSTLNVAEYRKMITRSNCGAKIRVCRLIDEKWKISLFDKEHNHPLVPTDQSFLLRSCRNLTFAKQGLLDAMHSVGIPITKACRFMEKECGGMHNVGFTPKDAYDHVSRARRLAKVADADATALLDYFNEKSNTEPFFFWKVERDDSGRLMNFFYRDGRCFSDYECFGDILSFDTTYRTNRYNLRCAPFISLNHHRKNVCFGIAFLSDESTRTFQWVLESFLESMNGKEPTVIFTDQDRALMNAIDTKLTKATHRLCQWHICRNAPNYFGPLNGNAEFKKKWFRCLKGVETELEFETLWRDMMDSYHIEERGWFDGMYKIRHRWASVFTQSVFTAGLLATSRSEGTNRVLKDISRSTGSLHDFVRAYEQVQTRWRANERAEDVRCMWVPGQFVNKNELLTQAATVYTRTVFKRFEHQCAESFNVAISVDKCVDKGLGFMEYKATRNGTSAPTRTVTFSKTSKFATCSCCLWEREGILCRHIIKVYVLNNVTTIPAPYILKRWTKKANDLIMIDNANVGASTCLISSMQFVNASMRMAYDIAFRAQESIQGQKLVRKSFAELREKMMMVGCIPDSSNGKKRKGFAGTPFRDPQVVKEGGFASANASRRAKRGTKKQCGVRELTRPMQTSNF